MGLFSRKKDGARPEKETPATRTVQPQPVAEAERNSEVGPSTARLWKASLVDEQFTVVEAIRANVPDELDTFATLNEADSQLAILRNGLGFGGALVSDRGTYLSPPWVNVTAGGVRRNGVWTVAGYPSHSWLGLPGALDLGAVDGRNMFQWGGQAPPGLVQPHSNLYVGNLNVGYLELIAIAGRVISLDRGRSKYVLALEQWDDLVLRLATVDTESSRRVYGFEVPHLIGNESVQYGADPSNALLCLRDEMLVVRPLDGIAIRLPAPGLLAASWWPSRGANTVAFVQLESNTAVLKAIDLATNSYEVVGPISDGEEGWASVTRLRIHPERDIALAGSRNGTTPEYREKHGTRVRAGILDMNTRTVQPNFDPFSGPDYFERSHSDWEWIDSPPSSASQLSDELMSSATRFQPTMDLPSSATAAKECHDLTIYATKAFVDHTDDPHRLRTEVLRYFEGVQRFGPDKGISDWLSMLSSRNAGALEDATRIFGGDRGKWPSNLRALANFASDLDSLLANQPGSIDWQASRDC
jgi:hypothetical protein